MAHVQLTLEEYHALMRLVESERESEGAHEQAVGSRNETSTEMRGVEWICHFCKKKFKSKLAMNKHKLKNHS
jgi:hypothetical protein